MSEIPSTPIDGQRLWASLMDMAQVGATPRGGNCRLAASDADAAGRRLFLDWIEAAGYPWWLDAVGNLFVRRPSTRDDLWPIRIGSHLDTQPSGGRFDGVLGVLAGLEILRTLDDEGIVTERPLEIVNWLNEEGARFAPPMMGSGVWSGALALETVLDTRGQDGARLGDELERLGWVDAAPACHRDNPAAGYLELHIEQGPVLENAGDVIGVVTGAQAQRLYEIELTGQDAHAGTTPMELRRDALVGAARAIEEVRALADEYPPNGRATVGILDVEPHSHNVIPGHVRMTVDLRHPLTVTLADLDCELRSRVQAIAESMQLQCTVNEVWQVPEQPFDAAMIEHVQRAADRLGHPHRRMISGAGHDAVHVAGVCPAAMVFVPCENGISHNEAENMQAEHAEAGCAVLFDAALAAAGRATA